MLNPVYHSWLVSRGLSRAQAEHVAENTKARDLGLLLSEADPQSRSRLVRSVLNGPAAPGCLEIALEHAGDDLDAVKAWREAAGDEELAGMADMSAAACLNVWLATRDTLAFTAMLQADYVELPRAAIIDWLWELSAQPIDDESVRCLYAAGYFNWSIVEEMSEHTLAAATLAAAGAWRPVSVWQQLIGKISAPLSEREMRLAAVVCREVESAPRYSPALFYAASLIDADPSGELAAQVKAASASGHRTVGRVGVDREVTLKLMSARRTAAVIDSLEALPPLLATRVFRWLTEADIAPDALASVVFQVGRRSPVCVEALNESTLRRLVMRDVRSTPPLSGVYSRVDPCWLADWLTTDVSYPAAVDVLRRAPAAANCLFSQWERQGLSVETLLTLGADWSGSLGDLVAAVRAIQR